MKTVRSAILPVGMLWKYREFRRDEVPLPCIPFVHHHNLEEITDYVSHNGIDHVELSIIKDRALLTDGNHRIVAAKRLGYEQIPVTVTVFFGDGHDTFYEHSLKRFKVIDWELENELKKIFL